MEINKDISGDYTIGFEGNCIWCKQVQKAYYVYADERRKRAMKDGTFMSLSAHCPSCKPKNVPNSMKWTRKLTKKEVVEDLTLLDYGMNIDFDHVEETVRHDKKMDAFIENQESKVKEWKAWKEKKV